MPKTSTPKAKNKTHDVTEVTRHIKPDVTAMLWGRAAGRCEFLGCNEPLWKSQATQESVNRAQRAHIYSFSDGGPRGNDGISKELLNDFDNLMLVCHGCHQTIDKHKDGGRYPVDLLQQWKAEHERRVEIVTGIDPAKKSHVVLYGANVDQHSSPLKFAETAHALFPRMHPAEGRAIQLGTINSEFTDRSDEFWEIESKSLQRKFDRQVRERLNDGEIEHLSVFAIAPQPLLILLGSMMTDIPRAEVFQLRREPQTWCWSEAPISTPFEVQAPDDTQSTPALVIALSATVTDDRIHEVLGDDISIWRITVQDPYNDLIQTRHQVSEFRATLRKLLNRIKECHGQQTLLHVFPVTGVSTAVEVGRVRQPKAEMPWQIYDQINVRGGFVPAISITSGTQS